MTSEYRQNRPTLKPQPVFKAGSAIKGLSVDDLVALYSHEAQQWALARVTTLIGRLRDCGGPSDFYEFQRHLFQSVYEVDSRRAECSRVAKRLRNGKSLPSDVQRVPERGSPDSVESWEFELFVYERIGRQLRSVGDALAWRSLGYNRRAISVLSRNGSPGPLVKGNDESTSGLRYEVGRVMEFYEDRGHFSLLNDLTNCIRIADLIEFDTDGKAWLHEVKRNPGRVTSVQKGRMSQAVEAIMAGGPLPGTPQDARLVDLWEPYRANVAQIADVVALARSRGSRGMKLPQGRALIGSSPLDLDRRCGADATEGIRIMDSERQGAIKRAGIADASLYVNGRSGDNAARSPVMVPWAIYPLDPADCAALICDLVAFETVVSVDALTGGLERCGIEVQVLLPPTGGEMSDEQDILRVSRGSRHMTVHAPSLAPLLYELLEPDTWAKGVAEVLAMHNPPASPVVIFADEQAAWLPGMSDRRGRARYRRSP